MKFEEIEKARKLLKLPEKVSIASIKKAYYEMTKKYHPDQCKEDNCKEKMQEISNAYKILMKYCEHYPISFKKDDNDKDDFDYYKRFYPDFI